MQQPSCRQRDSHTDKEVGPIAQMPFLDICHNKVAGEKLGFKTECSYEPARLIEPFGGVTKQSIEDENGCNGERNIQHPLHIKWELTVQLLFEEDRST